jgi:hypothetical protein
VGQKAGNETPPGMIGTGKCSMPEGPSVFYGYHPDYVKPDSATKVILLTQLEEQMKDNYNGEHNTYNTLDSYDIIISAIQEM